LPPHTGKYNAHTGGLGGWGCGLEQKVSIKKGKQIPIRRDSNFQKSKKRGHAFPVQPPLSDTEIEKKHQHCTVFGRFFTTSHKIRGPTEKQATQKKDRRRWAMGNVMMSNIT
jgi:hypothetical protein